MELRKVFARNLRLARTNARLSQEEIADAAGLDRTYISALERCLYSASLDTIERIADALGIEAADLLRVPERKISPRAQRRASER
jgi:transcriptional regulator with XRE-family HTH domain